MRHSACRGYRLRSGRAKRCALSAGEEIYPRLTDSFSQLRSTMKTKHLLVIGAATALFLSFGMGAWHLDLALALAGL